MAVEVQRMELFFQQPCKVCGRPLNVPVELSGSEIACSHCTGIFFADDVFLGHAHAGKHALGDSSLHSKQDEFVANNVLYPSDLKIPPHELLHESA